MKVLEKPSNNKSKQKPTGPTAPKPTKKQGEAMMADLKEFAAYRNLSFDLLRQSRERPGRPASGRREKRAKVAPPEYIARLREATRTVNMLKGPSGSMVEDRFRFGDTDWWFRPFDHVWTQDDGAIINGGVTWELDCLADFSGNNDHAAGGIGVDVYSYGGYQSVLAGCVGNCTWTFGGDYDGRNAQMETYFGLYDYQDGFWQIQPGYWPTFDVDQYGQGESGALILRSNVGTATDFFMLPDRWYALWAWQHGHAYEGTLVADTTISWFTMNYNPFG